MREVYYLERIAHGGKGAPGISSDKNRFRAARCEISVLFTDDEARAAKSFSRRCERILFFTYDERGREGCERMLLFREDQAHGSTEGRRDVRECYYLQRMRRIGFWTHRFSHRGM